LSLAVFLLSAALIAAASISSIRREEDGFRRRALYGCAGILAIPVLAILGSASAYAVNEWRLTRFGTPLLDAPLPVHTREVARTAAVGVLTGNGNHCDFVVSRQLESSLPIDSLEAHFATLPLRPAISGGAGGGLRAIEIHLDSSHYFTVTAIDAPYTGIFDPRCF
jgi:hypothetical protein